MSSNKNKIYVIDCTLVWKAYLVPTIVITVIINDNNFEEVIFLHIE